MKRFLAATLLAAPLIVQAQQHGTPYCQALSQLFNYAATYRYERMSPQDALAQMKPMESAQFPDPFVKAVINSVYFDPDLANVSAGEIVTTSFTQCINPTKPFTPLQ
jgi:hypothetical protein